MIKIQGSSTIDTVEYNPTTKKMIVKFKQGGIYRVDNVTPTLHTRFLNSSSKGAFYHENFKDNKKFPVTKLSGLSANTSLKESEENKKPENASIVDIKTKETIDVKEESRKFRLSSKLRNR
jgi:hypothetical protein